MTGIPATGDRAPSFELSDQDCNRITVKDYEGKWLVLYFYPKDNTGGCTTEAREFSELKQEFSALNTEIAGVSRDTPATHGNFILKQSLTITLLSDPLHETHEAYGAWRLKKNYGREYMGAARSTFLIDPEGVIRLVWPSPAARGHAEKVLEALRGMSQA